MKFAFLNLMDRDYWWQLDQGFGEGHVEVHVGDDQVVQKQKKNQEIVNELKYAVKALQPPPPTIAELAQVDSIRKAIGMPEVTKDCYSRYKLSAHIRLFLAVHSHHGEPVAVVYVYRSAHDRVDYSVAVSTFLNDIKRGAFHLLNEPDA